MKKNILFLGLMLFIFTFFIKNCFSYAASDYRGGYFGLTQVQTLSPASHVAKLSSLGFTNLMIKVNFPVDDTKAARLAAYAAAAKEANIPIFLCYNAVDNDIVSKTEVCKMSQDYWTALSARTKIIFEFARQYEIITGVVLDVEWYMNANPDTCYVPDGRAVVKEKVGGILSTNSKSEDNFSLGVLCFDGTWFAKGFLDAVTALHRDCFAFLEQSYQVGLSEKIVKVIQGYQIEFPNCNFVPGFWIQCLSPDQLQREMLASHYKYARFWIYNVTSLLDSQELFDTVYLLAFPLESYNDVFVTLSEKIREVDNGELPMPVVPTITAEEGIPPAPVKDINERMGRAKQIMESNNLFKVGMYAGKSLPRLRGVNTIYIGSSSVRTAKVVFNNIQIGNYRDMTAVTLYDGGSLNVPFLSEKEFKISLGAGCVPLVINSGRNAVSIEIKSDNCWVIGLSLESDPISLIKADSAFTVCFDKSTTSFSVRYKVDLPGEDAVLGLSEGSLWEITVEYKDNGERLARFTRSITGLTDKPLFNFRRRSLSTGFEDIKSIVIEGVPGFIMQPTDKQILEKPTKLRIR